MCRAVAARGEEPDSVRGRAYSWSTRPIAQNNRMQTTTIMSAVAKGGGIVVDRARVHTAQPPHDPFGGQSEENETGNEAARSGRTQDHGLGQTVAPRRDKKATQRGGAAENTDQSDDDHPVPADTRWLDILMGLPMA